MATKEYSIKLPVGTMGMTVLLSCLTALLLLTFLYDPDGSNYGQQLYPATGVGVVILTMLGDLVWMLGVVMLFTVGGIFKIVFGEDHPDDTVRLWVASAKIGRERIGKPLTAKDWAPGYSIHFLGVTALVGAASGFWFTGGLLTIIMFVVYAFLFKAQKAHAEFEKNGIPEDIMEKLKAAGLKKQPEKNITDEVTRVS